MPRRKVEIDPDKEYSHDELKRLKRNEYQRNYYARISEEKKAAMKEAMKAYTQQWHRAKHSDAECPESSQVRSMERIKCHDDSNVQIASMGATVPFGQICVHERPSDQNTCPSAEQLKRLKENDSRRRWYDSLPEDRKDAMRATMRKYKRTSSIKSQSHDGAHALNEQSSYAQNSAIEADTIEVTARESMHGSVVSVQHWQKQIRRMYSRRKAMASELKWNRICPHCGVALLELECDSFCCNNGKRILPKLPELPHALVEVYNENGFSTESRKINHLFCFTALGVDGGEFVRLDTPSSIALMGRTYHKICPTSTPHQPLHWYVHDSNERDRVALEKRVPLTWVARVAAVLDAINPYCKMIKRVTNMRMGSAFLTLDGSVAKDEVAAILHANNTVTLNPRMAVFWLHQDEREVYISILDPQYEPLQYPLFYPHGTKGWSPDNEQRMSQIDWYRCRLLHEGRFLQLGRLTCEYLVDMYSRVEEERLNFLATNGYDRSGSNNEDDFLQDEDSNHSRRFLPSSFIGCRQWCSVQIADALALARVKGPPSLFITMTTNPDWPEIKAMLRTGQTAADIPVVVVRSFHARFQQLKEFLRSYLGPLEYMVHVIEFQKRGLPHGHIVLKTVHNIPLHMIDLLVSAEIPSDDEELARKVRKYMVHQHSDRCSKDGPCCWKYPRALNHTTHIDSKGYVQYRRRKVEDTYVVSYSPFLLNQFDCHINVDVAATVHIFMYLYTYIYKGFDKVQYRIDGREPLQDEIHDYQSGRYLSSTEAAWRVLNFHITEKQPAVICLPLHREQRTRKSYRRPNTTSLLDRYFLRPNLVEFSQLTYVDYYEQYTFLPYTHARYLPEEYLEESRPGLARRIVRKRTKRDAICRIRLVMPHEGELFYLRQLLLHLAVRTWEDLKVYNGQTYDTYEQVVIAMGLLRDTTEHVITMQEAILSLQSPSQLRFLFALLILDGAPAIDLWNRFHSDLIRDFDDNSHGNTFIAEQEALVSIENILCQHGSTVTDFGLPAISTHSRLVLRELLKYSDHERYLQESRSMRIRMNANQARIYDYVLNMLNQPGVDMPIFIDGKAGTGKTFLLNAICLLIRGYNQIVLPCATTGLAAQLYPGGKTAHALFQIPVTENNVAVRSTMSLSSEKATLLIESVAIVWDEFAMANRAVIESVSDLLQQICKNNRPFGGKCFIAAGDFRQIAPIVHGAGRRATLNASIKSSETWKSFVVHKLHEPIRNAADQQLIDCVTSIGENWQSDTVTLDLFQTTTSLEDARDFLYPADVVANPFLCETRAFLSPLNAHVDDFNKSVLDRIGGPNKKYFSCDSIKENDRVIHTSALAENDFLHSYEHPTLPKHTLELKKGAICRLLRLLDANKGLVKNARVVVHALYDRYVTVRLLGQDAMDPENIHPICRADFFHQPQNCAFTIHRRQLPLRLAYSTTFHSCLGLTLDKIVLDLRTNVFAHGQLYTALTRVRRREDVLILHNNESPSVTTRNVVFKELLE